MTDSPLDELVRVYRDEKTLRDLGELPEDFYQSVAKHVSRLGQELDQGDTLRKELLGEELRNIVFMVQEVHISRVLKAMDRTARGRLPDQLVERERYAFGEIRQILEKLQDGLVAPAISGKVEVPVPPDLTNVLLLMLADVPERMIGADMKNYGPLSRGEVASIPARNAEMLMRHGVARKIAVRV